MEYIDVFNGDADGICALHQLRLAAPHQSGLITGVKRDIGLLKKVEATAGDQVTVLDISLDKNREALLSLLAKGVHIQYFDHHFSGELPRSDLLDAHIDTDANVCTSLLVNDYLQGDYLAWAVVAAFGDNLFDSARCAAQPLALSDVQLEQLAHLGTLLNYNGYGLTVDDLHITPEKLYQEIKPFTDPFLFISESATYQKLDDGYRADISQARALSPAIEDAHVSVISLPDVAWARRVVGVYGNELARSTPIRAHALLTELPGGDYRVSVRAPLANKAGADELCMQFPTGGGRKAAAGINALPASMKEAFISALQNKYS
ncbi:MAG: acetyltransferase [Mariprofundus sp.]|nr:acetyltransferase [Mariprofundus sp.]